MAVYLINIALIFFWRLYFTQSRFPDARKRFCTVAAVQWILVSGLRAVSVGADTENYYNIFQQVKVTSWRTVFGNFIGYSFRDVLGRDPGYTLVTKIFQIFSGSYQLFLLAVAFFFMAMMARWIYKYSPSPCTSFLLFSTLFYSFYAITGHRQTIATALVTFGGYEMIKQRKFWKFIAIVFPAVLIHKSSAVAVPFYFITKLPVSMGYIILCAVIVVVITILGEKVYGPIAHIMGYDDFLNYTEGGAELYATLLVLLCIIIWFLYPRIRQRRSDAPLLFHINVLTLISGLLVIQNQSFMRIQQYFSLFLMITIPEAINTVKREYRLLVYWLFGAVMIVYLIHNNPQYQFFFMEGLG